MKKSKLQVIIDFISQVSQLQSGKKESAGKNKTSTAKKLSLVIVALLCIQSSSFAFTYYSRGSGNWNVNSTWSTVGYGNPTNTQTFPKAGDVVNIGNGYTIYIAGNQTCATLNVGQGVSGTVEFRSTGAYSLTVTGNITVNTSAKIWYNSAVNQIHTLSVGGNIANYGTVDLYFAANQLVNLTFNTTINSTVTGTGTWDLNDVTLAKTTSTAAQLNVQSNTFETGIRNFVGTYGTYVHNNTTTYNINPTAATFIIGPNMIYQVPLGVMKFASATNQCVIQGSLYVNGGTVYVGTTAGTQGLYSDRNGTFTPYLEVSSGNLIVYGGITYSAASVTEPFSFKMTGGNILLNAGSTGTNRQLFYINDVASSSFNMSGGTITLQKPNTAGSSIADLSLCGTNGTVTSTAGTVLFGNALTPVGAIFNFRPNANGTFPNFRVSGQLGTANTLSTSFASTSNFKLLSLYIEAGKTFDIRSYGGATGDTKIMTLMAKTSNNIDAIYNDGTFTARQSTVTFNTSGAQGIGGTQVTSFYDLSINNTNHITLNKAANVTHYLSMVSGKLITTNVNVITCTSTANASLGSSISYVDGPMVNTVAASGTSVKTFPIGKSASYRAVVITVNHSNATSVLYRSEIFNTPASSLPYTYPPSISTVSHVRYARFSRQPIANLVNAQVQMYYSTDDVVADKNTLALAQDNGTSQWQNLGGTATANWIGNITSGTFTTFNTYFALANPPGGGNPLPIELSSFTANLNNKKVDVKWTTQSEINNGYFTIQRSADNETFTNLGTVEGAGTSSQTHNYIYSDMSPLSGISYYRLTQTDLDGHSETFSSSVVNNKTGTGFTVYPNPSNSGTIHLYGDNNARFSSVAVQDITGKIIPSETTFRENGTIDVHIDDAYTSKGGIFIVTASDGETSIRQKLIIN